jgi:hypothetical protein
MNCCLSVKLMIISHFLYCFCYDSTFIISTLLLLLSFLLCRCLHHCFFTLFITYCLSSTVRWYYVLVLWDRRRRGMEAEGDVGIWCKEGRVCGSSIYIYMERGLCSLIFSKLGMMLIWCIPWRNKKEPICR